MTLAAAVRRAGRLAARAYPTVALLCAGWLLFQGYRGYGEALRGQPWDIIVDWNGARVLRKGINPYSPEGLREGRGRDWIAVAGPNFPVNFGHPPTTFVWFLPLANLDLSAARALWDELTIFVLLLHLLLLATELELPSPFITTSLCLGAILCTSWMRDHLGIGQLSEAIAFLFVLGWYHLRRGREWSAGIALGLACTLKFYPATVVLLLLLCRRWRVAVAAALAWSAIAVPITWKLGASSWRLFLEQAAPYTRLWLGHIRNASLTGIVQRLRFPTCEFASAYRDQWAAGAWLAGAASLCLIALAWRVGHRALERSDSVDLPFALFTAVAMITGPYAWEHYDVTLILPLAVVSVALVRAHHKNLRARWIVAGASATVAVVLMLAEDMAQKTALWQQQFTPHKPSHFLLHFYEVTNWLPAPMLIALLAALLAWSRRRAPGAFDGLGVVRSHQ